MANDYYTHRRTRGELELDGETIRTAVELSHATEDAGFDAAAHHPANIAAAIIYTATAANADTAYLEVLGVEVDAPVAALAPIVEQLNTDIEDVKVTIPENIDPA